MDKWLCDGCQSKYMDCDEANETADGFLCETCWEAHCKDNDLCLCGQPKAGKWAQCAECLSDMAADYHYDQLMDR